jgi:hypothetical protein
MNLVVTSPITAISSSVHSHRAAQAVIYAEMLKELGDDVEVTVDMTGDLKVEDLSSFDGVYLYHGNDWSGAPNMFGGLKNGEYSEQVARLSRIRSPAYTLGIESPDYVSLLKPRVDKSLSEGKEVDPAWSSVNWENLAMKVGRANVGPPVNWTIERRMRSVVLGDSHAISLYSPGWAMASTPFKTLHGALKIGFEKMLHDRYGHSRFRNVSLYFGNIDVRHHLCRFPNPHEMSSNLARGYVDAAKILASSGKNVRIHELLPIENESRQVPKTGWYEGKPFHGTWAERTAVRNHLNDRLEALCSDSEVEFIRWTDYLLNDKGELSFDHMEKPRSVHLSRASYPYWQGLEFNRHQPKSSLEKFA